MMFMIQTLLEVTWLFLPAFVANMAPPIAARLGWLQRLNRPLDGGAIWHSRRVLGDNKTIRGVAVGIIAGALVGLLQNSLWFLPTMRNISLLSYDNLLTSIITGAWLGFAAMLGDTLASLLKRQLSIHPGSPWRPWDQLDFIISAILLISWLVPLTAAQLVTTFVIGGLGSYLTSAASVALRIKQSI